MFIGSFSRFVVIIDGSNVAKDAILIYEKYMWRTLGAKLRIYFLALIQNILKWKVFLAGALLHFLKTIIWLYIRIIGVDGNNGITFGSPFVMKLNDSVLIRYGIGTMIACKNDDIALGIGIICHRYHFSVSTFQLKIIDDVSDFILCRNRKNKGQDKQSSQNVFHSLFLWESLNNVFQLFNRVERLLVKFSLIVFVK